ncbi:MAG: PH domain-containing protein [Draconibacterium sp.]|nr:PH domain-containing protein [Draconibacterium sp.]
MENFTNSVLLPNDLPPVETEKFNRLDKKYLKISFFRILFFAIVIAGAFTAFLILAEEKPSTLILIIIISILALIIAYSILITVLGFPKKGYLLREKDLSYQKGLITYKLTSVPFNRIQHVEINQGILAKFLKLSSVKIYTAGGNASDLSIPGLPVEDAQKLKAFLSEKISEHE